MHFSLLATTARMALLLIFICGCGTPKSTAVSPNDALVKELVSFSPINGHWVGDGFAGQFDGLSFTKPRRINGEIVYKLKGEGELWTRNGPLPFKIEGESFGLTLKPILKLDNEKIHAIGEVARDSNGWPACSMVFTYQGFEYQANLDCVSNRATAKERFLAEPTMVASWKGKYTLTGTDHPIEFTISDKYRILGTYDDGDWRKGKVHGNTDKDGKFKFLLKYGNNPSFGQVLGKFTLSVDGKELRSDDARYEYNTVNPEEKRPQKATVLMTRAN